MRVVWKHFPLEFHPNAALAALASMAANEQGKFWEMHDKIFANQQTMDRPTYEKYAQELGLNMGKFKAALDAEKGKDAINAELARLKLPIPPAAQQAGAGGTAPAAGAPGAPAAGTAPKGAPGP